MSIGGDAKVRPAYPGEYIQAFEAILLITASVPGEYGRVILWRFLGKNNLLTEYLGLLARNLFNLANWKLLEGGKNEKVENYPVT